MASHSHKVVDVLDNVRCLLALASDLAIQNVARIDRPGHSGSEPTPGFFLTEADAEHLTALLIVTRDYAEMKLGEAD